MCFDQFLIKKAQKGDMQSLEKILFKYEKYVFNIALGFFKNTYDASDAAQEAMIKIYKKLSTYEFNSTLKTWIFRITVNTCKDQQKKKHELLGFDETSVAMSQIDPATPETKLMAKNQNEHVIHAINALDNDHKNVLILRELNDQTYDQIATTLGISIGTVKSRISRARNKVRDILIADGTF
jgi:RNA polymerase sigma-70 factor, ECF subfamily